MALTDSLISYWKLDEASGSRDDSHGTNHLTDNGSVGSGTGKIGTAADITTTTYLSCADNAALSTGDIDFTISVWCKADSFSGAYGQVLSKWSTDDANNEYLIDYTSDTTQTFRFGVRSGTTFGSVSWSSSASTATWYHIVAWHNATSNEILISVNNGTPVSAAWSIGVNDGDSTFMIGALGGFSGNVESHFDGLIDEVGFWKRVLTSDERTSLYNGGSGFAYPFVAAGIIVPPLRNRVMSPGHIFGGKCLC